MNDITFIHIFKSHQKQIQTKETAEKAQNNLILTIWIKRSKLIQNPFNKAN